MPTIRATLCMGGRCHLRSKRLVLPSPSSDDHDLSNSTPTLSQWIMCNQFAVLQHPRHGVILVDTGYHHRRHFETTARFPALLYQHVIFCEFFLNFKFYFHTIWK